MTARLPGCCALCDEPTHEVVAVWAQGHPFARQPHRLGKRLANAVTVTLALKSGARADVTLCRSCSAEIEDRLPEMWGRIKERFAAEWHARFHLGGEALDPEKEKIALVDLLRTFDDVPLGVIARQQ